MTGPGPIETPGPERGTSRSVLRAQGLTKVYGPGTPDAVTAIAGVDASFVGGGVHVIWGASGSGKTTLLSLLGALDRPTAGQVLLGCTSLGDCTEPERALFRRRTVGFLFQDSKLLPGLPVWANVSLAMVPDGYSPRVRREQARRQLAGLGLEEKLDRTPEQLSGGEAHRVALARALVRAPLVLLVDEPTAQLDEENGELVLSTLESVARAGSIVVATSHDPAVRARALWTTELRAGRVASSTGPSPWRPA